MAVDPHIFSWQTAQFRRLDRRVIQFERSHRLEANATYIDAYGPACHLFVCENPPEGLAINRRGKLHFHRSSVAMFLPPCSIVQWHLPVGHFQWTGYLLDSLPHEFPNEAVYFPWNQGWEIRGFDDIKNIFSQNIKFVPGGKEDTINLQARKAKTFIDQNFSESHSLEDIANATHTSRSSLTRNFRLSFGLSPIEYRNRVRVFHSIQKMLIERAQATQVGYESGFNDYSSYTRKFKQVIGDKPSVFRWQKEGHGS